MKRLLQITLLALSGLGVLHASLFSDLYLRYVKEGMRPLLIGSGVLLLALAAAEAWWGRKEDVGAHDEGAHDEGARDEGAHDEGAHDEGAHDEGARDKGAHDHSGTPKVAWLLLLPALSLLFYAPPALGAFTASREAPKAIAEEDHFDPLPATSPLPMTLTDFTQRVQQDREQAIKGRTVQLTGFVTPAGDGGWYLTRLILSCCAADAQSVKVRIHGVQAPPADTWVTLTGTWHASGTLGTKSASAALDAHTVRKIPKPTNGYTDALPLTPP
ncbi:TIGR03943 family protein [Streptomyces sp. TRM70350]|uniref:TIGR03943 family putative permease subunit n=1 Tax=Streptomyces sp. TRM70350 TaxID=2856165 RepID=UPI001C479B18|nr:TIGR03943 family protein [Streptomyces sp. TRM70350]MBV7700074.1 TIGR03943 family protein [Streptomyces sp. TRM70350]